MVLDIGTTMIKCLIIKIDPAQSKGYVLGVGHAELSIDDVLLGQIINIHSVSDQAANAIDQAVQLAGIKPKNIVCGLSGPAVISQTTSVLYNRTRPNQKITTKEFHDIFTHLLNESKHQIIKKQKNISSPSQELELINAAILELTIDDIVIKNPLDFTGRTLKFNIYQSFAPIMQIGALQSVADDLKLNLISIVNQGYALAKACDPTKYQYRNSLLIDIGGDITDIAIYIDGQLINTLCVPSGGNIFTRQLAKIMDTSHSKAEQYKKDYSENLLTEETEKQINNLFAPLAQEWLDNVIFHLKKLSLDSYPEKIYICGGGASLKEIQQAILLSNFPKELSLVSPSLKIMHLIDIESIVDKTTFMKNQTDIGSMAIANFGLQISDIESVSESIIKNIIQTLRT